MTSAEIVIHRSGDGQSVTYGGTTATFKLLSHQSDGGLSVIEFALPHGQAGGPPAHTHPHGEAFYVVEGSLEFLLGTERIRAEAGSFAFVPGGTAHTFAKRAVGAAKFLTMFVPGRFEAYFEEIAELFESTGGTYPEVARLSEIAARHGQVTVGPPLSLE